MPDLRSRMSGVRRVERKCARQRLGTRWIAATALLFSISPLSAQSDEDKVTIALTAPSAKPGGEAYINIMLTGVSVTAARVGEVREEIQIPKDKLEFVEHHIGIAAEMAGAELKLEKREGSLQGGADAANFYVISLALTGRKPIPDGPMVELVFKVPEGVEDQVVFLEHKPAIKIIEGNPPVDLVSEKGILPISKGPARRPSSSGGGTHHD